MVKYGKNISAIYVCFIYKHYIVLYTNKVVYNGKFE